MCSPPGERQRGVGGAGTCHGGRVSFLGALEQRLVLSLSSGGRKPQRRGQLQDLWGAGPLSLMTVTVGGVLSGAWCLLAHSVAAQPSWEGALRSLAYEELAIWGL